MERSSASILTREAKVSWHPQRRTLQPILTGSPKTNSENTVLDPKTKAEVEIRVAIHIRPEERVELFKQEGVTRYQYIKPSILQRVKDFLKI